MFVLLYCVPNIILLYNIIILYYVFCSIEANLEFAGTIYSWYLRFLSFVRWTIKLENEFVLGRLTGEIGKWTGCRNRITTKIILLLTSQFSYIGIRYILQYKFIILKALVWYWESDVDLWCLQSTLFTYLQINE